MSYIAVVVSLINPPFALHQVLLDGVSASFHLCNWQAVYHAALVSCYAIFSTEWLAHSPYQREAPRP